MPDNTLITNAKQASSLLARFLTHPQEEGLYKEIEAKAIAIGKKDIYADTISYAILALSDFIKNTYELQPDKTDTQWFIKKFTESLDLLEQMADTSDKSSAFNQATTKFIENNLVFEELQLYLVLKRRKVVLFGRSNKPFIFSTIKLLHDIAPQLLPLEQLLVNHLAFLLLTKQDDLSGLVSLWDQLVSAVSPLDSDVERAHAADAARIEVTKMVPSLTAETFFAAYAEAEIEEAHKVLIDLGSSSILDDQKLSDIYLLFVTLARSHPKEDSSFNALSSFARAAALARNLSLTLAQPAQKEVLSALINMAKGLLLFLENRYGLPSDFEKIEAIKQASHILKDNFQIIIQASDNVLRTKI